MRDHDDDLCQNLKKTREMRIIIIIINVWRKKNAMSNNDIWLGNENLNLFP